MSAPTLIVIMPTIGRSTLGRAISSVIDQLEEGEELIVIGDSAYEHDARSVVDDFQPGPLVYVECQRPGSVFGNAQRSFGMELAAGRSSHIAFLDDDDVWTHGAGDTIRWALGATKDTAHIFRATWGPGHHAHGVTLWSDREVRESNIATPMVVLPNRPYARTWMDGNDRYFVSDFACLSPAIGECSGVEWHEEVVAVVRPG